MSVLKQSFQSAEPSKKFNRALSRRPQRIRGRKPDRIRKPAYKTVFRWVKSLKDYESFEEWLARLQGPAAPTIRTRAQQWRRRNHVPGALSLAQIALFTTFLLAAWPEPSSGDMGEAVMAEMRTEGDLPSLTVYNGAQDVVERSVVPRPVVKQRQTGSERRRIRREKRNDVYRNKLLELFRMRNARQPAENALDFMTSGKWLQYMMGTLADDNAYFETEMNSIRNLLEQVYELVDGPLDGAQAGGRKREFMAPVLKPVIFDLAVHALRTDWAFVNASFHKKIYEDSASSQMQMRRAEKIVQRLADEVDLPSLPLEVVPAILRRVDASPIAWYETKQKTLIGQNVVFFLRNTVKAYVRNVLDNIPENEPVAAKRTFHIAAVMDASTSGRKIARIVSERSPVNRLSVGSKNPTSAEIVDHYRSMLMDEKERRQSLEGAIDSLIVDSLGEDRAKKIVRDVRLLWSIYDESSENAFRAREKERYEGMASRFLNSVLRPFREKDAEWRGHRAGQEYFNNIVQQYLNKVLIGIFTIYGAGSQIGCSSCRRKRNKKPAASPPAKDKVVNQDVYKLDQSSKLWILENNIYRGISNRGHSDYYVRIVRKISVQRAKMPRLVGRINANSVFERDA